MVLLPYLLFLLCYIVLIIVGGIRFISINIYSNVEFLCVDSYCVIIYSSAHVLYVYAPPPPPFPYIYDFLYTCAFLCAFMYIGILLVHEYDLIFTCVPVYLFICRFLFPRGVIWFIVLTLIYISTALSWSSFHIASFIFLSWFEVEWFYWYILHQVDPSLISSMGVCHYL